MSNVQQSGTGVLAGRVVIVTGGAGGLGRVFSAALAAEGAAVAVADLDPARATDVATDIGVAGREAAGFALDVTDAESVAACVAGVGDRFGRIDVLVNNAALLSNAHRRPLETFTADEWLTTMAVNVVGPASMVTACLPWLERDGGAVVNIASSTVFNGARDLAPYIASKGGLIGLTKAAARELGERGIRVNAVTPGFVDVRAVPDPPAEQLPAHAAAIATRCLPRAQVGADLVGAVVFLASDASGFVTGQTINVDGGVNLH